ncbi:AbrB family transcriptional regulator [Candidatus Bathyarchaeota archaeon]|jgi:bifunctional DNA-binding transcriptional regulator/antitoxin component of YhaV-PrlF toxin-antitoxin module|nr:AbrB family transcriptional regulator [Candidatus Bathyarchaeota archaeon]
MGEITTLTIAATGKESLRTTVPMSIIKHFKLKASDKLDWDFEARNNELVIVVRPLKKSNGKRAITAENISEDKATYT